MENEVGNKFLPIGTVVILKNGTKKLMISGYCTIPKGEIYNKNGKVENKGMVIFDYCGYFYPEGLATNDKILAFDHDQIAKVCFKGYETDEFKELSKQMVEDIEKIKSKIKESAPQIKEYIEEKKEKENNIQAKSELANSII